MSGTTGPRITLVIGVVAICLAAISPAGIWAAEPGKQEKKAQKPAKMGKSAPPSKATAPKFASAETAGKAPSCFGEAPRLDKLTPDEGFGAGLHEAETTRAGSAPPLGRPTRVRFPLRARPVIEDAPATLYLEAELRWGGEKQDALRHTLEHIYASEPPGPPHASR